MRSGRRSDAEIGEHFRNRIVLSLTMRDRKELSREACVLQRGRRPSPHPPFPPFPPPTAATDARGERVRDREGKGDCEACPILLENNDASKLDHCTTTTPFTS